MIVTYRRNGVLVYRRELPAKPVDQMTREELKAEHTRRMPCCGPEVNAPAAQGG